MLDTGQHSHIHSPPAHVSRLHSADRHCTNLDLTYTPRVPWYATLTSAASSPFVSERQLRQRWALSLIGECRDTEGEATPFHTYGRRDGTRHSARPTVSCMIELGTWFTHHVCQRRATSWLFQRRFLTYSGSSLPFISRLVSYNFQWLVKVIYFFVN